MLSPRASVSNPAQRSYSQDVLSLKPMVLSALEPHRVHDQLLLWGAGIKPEQRAHPAKPTVPLPTESISAELPNPMRKAKAHIQPQ